MSPHDLPGEAPLWRRLKDQGKGVRLRRIARMTDFYGATSFSPFIINRFFTLLFTKNG
jgi:hypothetical protein